MGSSVDYDKKAKKGAIRAFLTQNSSLTRTQLAAVLSYIGGDHTTGERGSRALSGRRVSKGAFFRSLSQARRKIQSAIYTLALLVYEGVLSQRDIDNITIVGSLLRELAETEDTVEIGEIEQIFEKSQAIIAKTVKDMTGKRS